MLCLVKKGSWSLIGLIAAMAIIVIAAALYFTGDHSSVSKDSPLLDQSSTKTTVIGKSLDTAKAFECKNQLDQIRKGIDMYRQNTGADENPASLADIQLGVGASFYKCPVSGLDYIYDPGTGRVGCPTHTDK